jgi:DNA topoisomerase-1
MPPKYFKSFSKNASHATKNKVMNVITKPSTAKWLIIVESPSKCKKIEEYLGVDYLCIATKGHFRSIDGLKSINTKGNFEPVFSIIKEKENQVNMIRSIISQFSKENVILASDDDREGEAIAWHICQVFGLPTETTKRILFHEVTRPALLAAVQNPVIIDMKLVHAQHARQVLDIIVGFKVSPYLWKYVSGGSASLSAGRCQSPALRLIYDNETERIANKENNQWYKTIASFTAKQIPFELDKKYETKEEIIAFLEASKTHSHMLSIGNPKESHSSPPKPFQTSRLLQTASNVLHISPKETMQHCQELYQNGHITYMRTESTQYSKTFLEIMKGFISKEYGENYLGDLEKLENRNTANPHEAIRVTHIERQTITTENVRRNAVYQLIWRNTVESCMTTAVYQNTEISLSAAFGGVFSYTIEIPRFLGWKRITNTSKNGSDAQNTPTALLFWFQSIEKSKKPVSYNWIENTIIIQKKHSYYTEASLIQKLEEIGIGRPSTYAVIVDTLLEREYVVRKDVPGFLVKCTEFKMYSDGLIEQIIKDRTFGNEKNKLVIESKGILVIEFLIHYFESLFSYEYTKNMETNLDLISNGEKKEWSSICKLCYQEIKEMSKNVTAITKQTYRIDDEHEFLFTKFGPAIRCIGKESGEHEYLSVKKDLNIHIPKLIEGKYTLEELVEIKTSCLGIYEGEEVHIKTGKYGLYVECGEISKSLKGFKKKLTEINLEDVIPYLTGEQTTNKKVLRILCPEISIRKGRFGAYAFYQTVDMEKPAFFPIKKFPGVFSSCEKDVLIKWLCETYDIRVPS